MSDDGMNDDGMNDEGMNDDGRSDDELADSLRAVLAGRAGRLHPTPGRLPTARPGPVPAPGPDRWFRRPRLLVGLAAAALVVAGAAAAAAVSGGGHPSPALRTRTATAPTGSVAPAAAPTTSTSVAVTVAPPPTAAPTTTTPPPAVPAGFRPQSATFVSAAAGWVLGAAPCPAGTCESVAATTDGGAHWSPLPAPPLHLAAGALPPGIRFADGRDGWAYTSDQLWSTHDGGATWHSQVVPGGSGAVIGDLEASAGRAWLVVIRPGTGAEGIYSTPATADTWTASPLAPAFGGGPVPGARIVLQGRAGWIVTVNRVVVSGARDLSGAGWAAWSPPWCRDNGPAGLAAASPTDLVAWCAEGQWGPPDPGTAAGQVWLFRSGDAGTTFSPVAPVPATSVEALSAAPGSPQVLLVATPGAILRSTDGGTAWSTVYRSAGTGPGYVGFTTSGQAFALDGTTMVMSRDGGATWSPVTF